MLHVLNAGDPIQTVSSPDGRWTVRLYFVLDPKDSDGGEIRVTSRDRIGLVREVARLKDIGALVWTGQDEASVDVQWLGGSRASIGGREVDLASGWFCPW
jgi:hypothetical protein